MQCKMHYLKFRPHLFVLLYTPSITPYHTVQTHIVLFCHLTLVGSPTQNVILFMHCFFYKTAHKTVTGIKAPHNNFCRNLFAVQKHTYFYILITWHFIKCMNLYIYTHIYIYSSALNSTHES
jgi:hypothetical protein